MEDTRIIKSFRLNLPGNFPSCSDFWILSNICKEITGKSVRLDPHTKREVYQTSEEVILIESNEFLFLLLHEIGHYLGATEKERKEPNLLLDTLPPSILDDREMVAFYFENCVAFYVQNRNFYDAYYINNYHIMETDKVCPYECVYSKIQDEDVIKVGDAVRKFLWKNPTLWKQYRETCSFVRKEDYEKGL